MRIDLSGAATEIGLEDAASAKPVSSGRSVAPALPEDTATLSSDNFSVASLASQVLASAAARGAKVEALRHAVASAEYTVDPALIADAMVSEGA